MVLSREYSSYKIKYIYVCVDIYNYNFQLQG